MATATKCKVTIEMPENKEPATQLTLVREPSKPQGHAIPAPPAVIPVPPVVKNDKGARVYECKRDHAIATLQYLGRLISGLDARNPDSELTAKLTEAYAAIESADAIARTLPENWRVSQGPAKATPIKVGDVVRIDASKAPKAMQAALAGEDFGTLVVAVIRDKGACTLETTKDKAKVFAPLKCLVLA